MSDLIKIDKRNGKTGYCIIAQGDYVAIIQGSGSQQRVVHLNSSELQPLLAAMENVVTRLSQADCAEVL
jgi:hypothetical protein